MDPKATHTGSQQQLHSIRPRQPSIFTKVRGSVRTALGFPLAEGIGTPINSKPRRKVYVNIPVPAVECDHHGRPIVVFCGNMIQTAKYTILTFLPKNLFEQFRRLANLYFLIMVIMQVFPMFGVASPILAAMPLIVIMSITGVKDGFEDYRRHKTDETVNFAQTQTLQNWKNVNRVDCRSWRDIFSFGKLNAIRVEPLSPVASKAPLGKAKGKKARIVTPNDESDTAADGPKLREGWGPCAWKDLHIGDYVLLRANDRIPADILVISTDDPLSACFVETKGLDGETNLKCLEGLKETHHIRTAEDCKAARLIIEAEAPTLNLYTFSGTLTLQTQMTQSSSVLDMDAGSRKVPINVQNILLRGSTLRNSEWVIGIVLFTGLDSKVVLNSGKTPSKRSLIEKLMNWQVVMNFAMLIMMCVVIAILDAHYERRWAHSHPPWIPGKLVGGRVGPAPRTAGFYTFFASMIMLQNVVPISLYITVEGVKTIQAYFIYSDIEMYYEPTDDACVPKSWNISDDLGQIEYIFSDKTGTLTQNKMDFLRCSVGGAAYGEGYTDVTADSEGIDIQTRASRMAEMSADMKTSMNQVWKNPYLNATLGFVDKTICKDYFNIPSQRMQLEMFFTILAVCHTVVSPKEPLDGQNHPVTYSAQSPDEQALVTGAKDFGVIFESRVQDVVTILVHGVPRSYRVLNTLEFTSTRKRMSVVVQLMEEPKTILLFSKGADSVLYERLAEGQAGIKKVTFEHLERFANEGLRTLVLAYRVIPEAEARKWCELHHKAACALVNRDQELEAVAELIEVDLTLVGATAIEDKLQEQVPECITLLRSAGIKLWVLTGDKLETALNISFAANLLTSSQTLLILRAHTPLTIVTQLRETYLQLQNPTNEVAMIIDGESLGHALATEEGQQLLLEVGTRCVCVVCCRVSPKQKAQVVRLVKHGKNVMCAAIGDGANDVSMIQEANIGIGISGLEGLQAALAADYVIAQFRYLSRLILVHGRWSYYRTSETILNFFYKNMTWVFALFWYQFYCGFSGRILFDYTYLMFFNLIFTSLLSLVLGIFDQDVNAHYALSIPPLYGIGLRRLLFTTPRFFQAVFQAVYQSLLCFFIPYLAAPQQWSAPELGSLVALCVIVTVNLGVSMSIKNWTGIVVAAVTLSIGSFLVYIPVYAAFPTSNATGTLPSTYGHVEFWAALFLAVVCSLGPRIVYGVLKSASRHPGDLELIRERQKYNLGVPPRVIRVGKTEADIVLLEEPMVGRRISLRQLELSKSLLNLDEAEDVQPHLGKVSSNLYPASVTEEEADQDGEWQEPVLLSGPVPLATVDLEAQEGPRSGRAARSAPPNRLTIITKTSMTQVQQGSMTGRNGHTSLHFMDSGAISANTGFAFSFDDHFSSRAQVASPTEDLHPENELRRSDELRRRVMSDACLYERKSTDPLSD
ncbi:hypothetical protein HKX48_002791 [Thoreauomyces humboldtii]|nr:hypothetical protein HKX48_002791 [Thoreauomyces humboldtii]